MTTFETFAQLLDDLMRDSGLNGKQLADRVGVKPTSISGWRRGRDQPDGESLRLVALVLLETIPKSEVARLVRAWVELRLGSVAELVREPKEDCRLNEGLDRQSLDQILWRCSAAQRQRLRRLLLAADQHVKVRDALLALDECLATPQGEKPAVLPASEAT